MAKTILRLTRHATINTYLYNDHNEETQVNTLPDRLSLSNMYLLSLLDFDASALAGRVIHSARLELTARTPVPSRSFDVSTVTHPWNAASCTYLEADDGRPWAYGGFASDVVMGAGHSQVCACPIDYDAAAGKVSLFIPPAIICALAAGRSHGIALLDRGSVFYSHPGHMYTHKMDFAAGPDAQAPRLYIEYEEAEGGAPAPVDGLRAQPVEAEAGERGQAVQLLWDYDAPTDARLHYRALMREGDGAWCPVPAFVLPNVNEGCAALVRGLAPDTEYTFRLFVSDGAHTSSYTQTCARTLAARALPEAGKAVPVKTPANDTAAQCAHFSVRVCGELAKVDPLTGKDHVFGEHESRNAGLWDGERVLLACAGDETLAFQLAITSATEQASFAVDMDGAVPASVHLYALWCMREGDAWYPDAAVPVQDGQFQIPFEENRIPGQRALSLLVEVKMAQGCPAGVHTFALRIRSGESEAVIPVCLTAAGYTLPESAFRMELNGYVYPPACAGLSQDEPGAQETEQAYYLLGAMHGGVVNILPYSHVGEVQPGYAPEVGMVDGRMRVTDWTRWDRHFAPLLDGRFACGMGGRRRPVSHIYLPIHENWPMPVRDHYLPKAPEGLAYPDNVSWHMVNRRTPEEDFTPAYREGIKSVLMDFIAHIDEMGWHDTEFQYFFNNKNFYKQPGAHARFGPGLDRWLGSRTIPDDGGASSWWLLDEPHFHQDWEMLRFYGEILAEARRESGSGRNVQFRADLSCFNQAYRYLDGLLDINVVGGRYAALRGDVLRARRRMYGERNWPYGTWNAIDQDNLHTVLWILGVYLGGGDGVVPWYSYGLDENYEQAHTLAAIYPGQRFGNTMPVASLRLKAGRRAMELVRHLEAFRTVFGYDDAQLRRYVSGFVCLEGDIRRTDAMDAGSTVFGGENDDVEALRRDIIRRVAAQRGAY